ncbi:MAG: hypothetical protein JWO68_4215 [Actinomycetia bacterium]|nr:hypothetical protein [Actinomycetes bacterium]
MDDADLDALLDSGVSMLGACAVDGLAPEAFRVWGASIDDQGRLRMLVSGDATRTLASVEAGVRMSFVVTDVTTFRSLQVKGPATGPPEPPTNVDISCLRRYHRTFVDALAVIGHPPLLAERLRPLSVQAVTMGIEAVFDQSPGPVAGAPLGSVAGA